MPSRRTTLRSCHGGCGRRAGDVPTYGIMSAGRPGTTLRPLTWQSRDAGADVVARVPGSSGAGSAGSGRVDEAMSRTTLSSVGSSSRLVSAAPGRAGEAVAVGLGAVVARRSRPSCGTDSRTPPGARRLLAEQDGRAHGAGGQATPRITGRRAPGPARPPPGPAPGAEPRARRRAVPLAVAGSDGAVVRASGTWRSTPPAASPAVTPTAAKSAAVEPNRHRVPATD
jgi:hypothetical protein